jgi:DNA-binding ferritin-like protein
MAFLTKRHLSDLDKVSTSDINPKQKKMAALAGSTGVAPENQFITKIVMDPNVDPNHNIGVEHMLGEWGGIRYSELSVILVQLRYLANMHQTHHWVSKGDPFYGDHLLFQRLYETVVGEIDSLAEKAVGLGSERNVDLSLQLKQLEKMCSGAYGMTQMIPSPTELIKRSLAAEKNFIKTVSILVQSMKDQGLLTRGLDNMLAGIEDVHESHVYLLKQRSSAGV